MPDKTINPETSTDPRQNIIPEAPQGYLNSLYQYVLPDGYDMAAERKNFASEAFRLGLNLKQASDLFHKKMTDIIDTHRTAKAQGREQERAESFMSAVEADNVLEQIYNNPKHAYNDDHATREMRSRANFYVETLLRIKNGEEGWTEARIESEYRRQKQEGFKTFSDITKERVTTLPTDHTSRSYEDVNEPARRQNGNPAPQIDGQEPNE